MKFSSVESAMLHLAFQIENRFKGNFASWHTTDEATQKAYRAYMKYVRWDITKELKKEFS